jgi:transcriptional regulator with PAS, ATPase and Fis domain
MTKEDLIVYEPEDYKGCYNLLASEKRLIIRAHKRHFGNKRMMAKALEISYRQLMRLIYQHSL